MNDEKYHGDFIVVYIFMCCLIAMGVVFGYTAHMFIHDCKSDQKIETIK